MAGKRMTKREKSQSFAQTFRRILDGRPDASELAALEELPAGLAEGMTRDEVIASSLVRRAMRGDLTAAKFISELADAAMPDAAAEKPARYTLTLRVREDGG